LGRPRSGLRGGIVAGLLALFALSPEVAHAQNSGDKAAAEALFQAGRDLMSQKKYAEACGKFEASNRLDAGLGTLLFLADCYEKAGRFASAWATFREAESIAAGRSDGPRTQIAKDRAAALEPRLSKLWVKVSPDNPETTQVMRDGAMVPRESWGIALPTDAGEHTLTATATGRKPWSAKVVIQGENQNVSIEVPALEVAPEEPKPAGSGTDPGADYDPHRGRTQRIIGIATAGAGVVALGVGTYFGFRAMSKNDDSKAFCDPNNETSCTEQGVALREDAFSAADTATGLFIAGGALAATGLVVFLTAPSNPEKAATAPALRLVANGSAAKLSIGGAW
jgi:serine/threonine-protein kinase